MPDGYRYHRNNFGFSKALQMAVVYLVCSMSGAPHHCPGKARLFDDGTFKPDFSNPHRCFQNSAEARFRTDLHTEIGTNIMNHERAYKKSREKYPLAAAQTPLVKLKRTLNRWSRIICPCVVTHLVDLANCLNLPVWVERFQYFIKERVFGSPEFIRKALESTYALIDATFQSVPYIKGAYQFLTIMVEKFGKGVPLVYAQMSRKTQTAYEAVFKLITEEIAEKLKPDILITDFELCLMNSAKMFWKGAKIQGCWFHYVYCITKNLKKMGIEKMLPQTLIGRDYVRDVKNLPLLPAGCIEAAFQLLTKELLESTNTVLLDGQEITVAFLMKPFINYYREYWIKIVTPARFSIFSSNIRTNNPLKRFQRTVHDYLGTRPLLLSFLDNFVKIQKDMHLQFLRMEASGSPAKKKKPPKVSSSREG